MDNYKLLTLDDLTARWNKSERTIKQYVSDGKLKRCENLGYVFRPEEVARFEGGEAREFSYIERRNLLAEIEYWKNKSKQSEKVLIEIMQTISMAISVNIENRN
ncbi:hypothetical protein QJR26_12370 [Clostridium baratii]